MCSKSFLVFTSIFSLKIIFFYIAKNNIVTKRDRWRNGKENKERGRRDGEGEKGRENVGSNGKWNTSR